MKKIDIAFKHNDIFESKVLSFLLFTLMKVASVFKIISCYDGSGTLGYNTTKILSLTGNKIRNLLIQRPVPDR